MIKIFALYLPYRVWELGRILIGGGFISDGSKGRTGPGTSTYPGVSYPARVLGFGVILRGVGVVGSPTYLLTSDIRVWFYHTWEPMDNRPSRRLGFATIKAARVMSLGAGGWLSLHHLLNGEFLL